MRACVVVVGCPRGFYAARVRYRYVTERGGGWNLLQGVFVFEIQDGQSTVLCMHAYVSSCVGLSVHNFVYLHSI